MNNKPILVTGASGFVGEHMVRLLRNKDLPVRAMVRDKAKATNLEAMGAKITVADLGDEQSIREAVQGVETIYHIASIFRQAGLPDQTFHDINRDGVRRLFDAAIDAGVERIIHCSTVGVLGHIANPPGTEETPHNPGDIYQRTKLEGEELAMQYYTSGKMRGAVIRPAMIYGPGDTRTLKLFRMIKKKIFFYVGKGQCSVHFIDVRDLVQAFYLAMNKTDINAELYIISGEKAVPLQYMANQVAELLGVRPPWLHLPVKPMQWLGDICEAICTPLHIQPPIYRRRVDFYTKSRHFDSSKAHRDLGFVPAQTFEKELAEIIGWYKNNNWL